MVGQGAGAVEREIEVRERVCVYEGRGFIVADPREE